MLIKYFVPNDRALKLKKLGFDEECFGTFYEDSIYSEASCRFRIDELKRLL